MTSSRPNVSQAYQFYHISSDITQTPSNSFQCFSLMRFCNFLWLFQPSLLYLLTLKDTSPSFPPIFVSHLSGCSPTSALSSSSHSFSTLVPLISNSNKRATLTKFNGLQLPLLQYSKQHSSFSQTFLTFFVSSDPTNMIRTILLL